MKIVPFTESDEKFMKKKEREKSLVETLIHITHTRYNKLVNVCILIVLFSICPFILFLCNHLRRFGVDFDFV